MGLHKVPVFWFWLHDIRLEFYYQIYQRLFAEIFRRATKKYTLEKFDLIMTQEDRKLLLQDLCSRLPYGVKCTTKSSWNGIYTIEGYKDNRVFLDCPVYDEGDDEWMIESIVPYLRPMSSMTEQEKRELSAKYNWSIRGNDISIRYHSEGYWDDDTECPTNEYLKLFDWLNSHHFDYRSLIECGLAIAVTEENNPYKG